MSGSRHDWRGACDGVADPVDAVALRPASWQHDRDALQFVRRRVFVEEQGVPEDEEWDAADLTALHVLAVVADRDPVGTGRLEPCGKIGRVAVLREWRGSGVGGQVMRHLVNQATELGFEAVYLHAQTTATGFYRRLGFRAEGPVFDEVGIPHVRMHMGIERRDGNETGRHQHQEHPRDAR
jgi:predicted GNAT family N-acyltransferase